MNELLKSWVFKLMKLFILLGFSISIHLFFLNFISLSL
ncbi:putative membrane protein [Acinetobacter baumannii 1437282]|nr:putative membrane protein [Acinetobacter baumannii 1437282]